MLKVREVQVTGLSQASAGVGANHWDPKGYPVHLLLRWNGVWEQCTFLPLHEPKSVSSVVAAIIQFLSNPNDPRGKQSQVTPIKGLVLPFVTSEWGHLMHALRTHLSLPCALLSSPLALHGSWNGLKCICTSCDYQNLLISKLSSKVKPRFHHCTREQSPHMILLPTDSINGGGLHITNWAFLD